MCHLDPLPKTHAFRSLTPLRRKPIRGRASLSLKPSVTESRKKKKQQQKLQNKILPTLSSSSSSKSSKFFKERLQWHLIAGFEILAFPCNQFGGQEPGLNGEIKQFACTRFKPKFPISEINGPSTASVYQFLKSSAGGFLGDIIKWNFEKFLVDKNGKVVERYPPTTSPFQIELVIACGESSPSHIALLICLNRTLDSIKHNITRIFVNILCCQANNARGKDLLPTTFEDFMKKWDENYHLSAQRWFSKEKNSDGEQDPYAVFNALDAMLKDSLERLKTMRESISMAEMGFISCSSIVNYMDHMGIIRVLCMDGKLGTAFWLRRKIIKKGFVPDVLMHNYLLNGLCKTGHLEKADWLIRKMLEMGPPPNCATYNTFIKVYCLLDDVYKALYLFSTMSNSGISPNRVTCNILVHALCKRGLMENAKKLLNKILDDDYDKTASDLITSTRLMDGYLKNGNMVQALRIWDDMVQMKTQVDVVAYNVLINGFCLSRDMNLAHGSLCELIKRGLLPNVITFNTLISGLCKEGKLEEACYIHESTSKMGVTPNQVSYKIIVQGLCIKGEVFRANKFLLRMLEKSMVPEPLLWNCIIDCYGRYGDLSAALSVKDHMFASGVQPNVYTYNALIHAQVKGRNIDRALCG